MTPYQPLDPNTRFWNNKLTELRLNALESVTGSAEKWAGTVGALTGLFGIVAFAKGREDINELATWARLLVAVIAGLALLSAIIATVLAARASQGVLRKAQQGATDFEDQYEKWVNDAARRLKGSRIWTYIAIGLLFFGTGLLYFGPGQPQSEKVSLIIPRTGSPLCGKILTDPGGQVRFMPLVEASVTPAAGTTNQQPVTAIEIRDIISITTVESCR